MCKKRKLYLTYRNSNNPNHKEHYKKYCRILSKVITAAKKLYYNKLILRSNNKQKTAWKIIKTLTNNTKNTGNKISTMNINDTLSTNPIGTANAFNTYFTSVAENLLTKNFSKRGSTNNNDPMIYLQQNLNLSSSTVKLKNTTTHKINKVIHSLKSKNSHGYDEISSKILKASAPYVLSPLKYIFNKVLSTGIFPD